MPFANTLPIKVPHDPPDERFVYLSDALPTAWQAVEYAQVSPGGSVVVLGLGPIGDMACRIAQHLGADQVIGVDLVPERLKRAAHRGVTVFDLRESADIAGAIRDLTDGRGSDSVIDAVGMEAHGAPVAKAAHHLTALLPGSLAATLMRTAGLDRLAALYSAIDIVRRGGTISIVGVYGGMTDPLPLLTLFDKQIQLRMGQATVKRWIGDILPLLADADLLGVEGFATHHLSLEDAPMGYHIFKAKRDGAIKVLLVP